MRITNTADVHKSGTKLLVYGSSGIGKTTLAGHLTSPTLIISAEAGLMSLKGTKIDVLDIQRDDAGNILAPQDRPARLGEIYKFLLLPETQAKYKNIFLDSITEIAQNVLAIHEAIQKQDIASGKKPDGFRLWGDYGKQVIGIVKAFRDIPHYNVVFTCLEELDKDESGRRFYGPEIPGNAAKAFLMPAFDLVFRLAALPDNKRVFVTSRTDTVQAKARGVTLNPIESAQKEDGGLQRIFDLITKDEEKK